MQKLRPHLIVFLAALMLIGCVPENPTPELIDPSGFVTYVHPTNTFALNMPPDWIVNDTSDAFAVNTAFSAPGAPEPLITIYLATIDALAPGVIIVSNPGTDAEATQQAPAPNLDTLITAYQSHVISTSDTTTFKEIARTPQADGSLRIDYLIDSPNGTSQHNDFVSVNGPYFVTMRLRLPPEGSQLRVLERIMNTLAINPNAGWASVLADSVAGQAIVGFAGLNAWSDRNGGFEIVGQVVNNAPLSLEFVRITARLYDEAGTALAERDDFVSSDLIAPGEYAPFSIVFTGGVPPNTVRYDLNVSARYAEYTAQQFYGEENFEVSSAADFDENGLLVVSGQVRNEGALTAGLVKVIVTVFGEDNRVIATDTTLVDQQRLAPSDVTTYEVTFVELGGDPSTFLVTAQGIVEASVDE